MPALVLLKDLSNINPSKANTSSTRRSRSAHHAVRITQIQHHPPLAPDPPTETRHPALKIIGRKWFDCTDCHAEAESHPLLQTFDMTFACKKCKKCFRKDAKEFEESDEYCPHCDNHFVLDALTPKAAISVEGADVRVDSRMIKDERVKPASKQQPVTIFDPDVEADKLG